MAPVSSSKLAFVTPSANNRSDAMRLTKELKMQSILEYLLSDAATLP